MQISIKDILIRINQTDWMDETEIRESNYSIRLFPPTIISSAFECFEVHIDRNSVDTDEYDVPDVFVVKIGQEKADREGEILQELNKRGFQVPKIYGRIVMRNTRESINIILEEFIPGDTLFENGNDENWMKFATALADFHKGFWNKNTGVDSPRIRDRVNEAAWFSVQHPQYIPACKKAMEIVSRCTKTFLHGDLVPTNVMISEGNIKFIDLNDGGTAPYVLDIARAISCVDPLTIKRYCPEPEELCRAYYDSMHDRLGSFEEFRTDVRAAEFLECSALAYEAECSGSAGRVERAFADYMKMKVKELMAKLA